MELKDKPQMLVTEITQFPGRQLARVNTIYHHTTCIRFVQRADNLQQRRLTGTRRTDDTHHLTFIDMEVDALQHFQRSKTLMDILNCYHTLTY